MSNICCIAALALAVSVTIVHATETWYEFKPANDPAPGEIGLTAWLEKPAGKHGRIKRQGEFLMYNDAPIKLWGINQCYGTCLPKKELADKRAAFYPKFGINSVRFHKFTEYSDYLQKDTAIEIRAEGVDRMDYQVAKLKEAGIYVNLSVHFGGIMIGRRDRAYVPFLREFEAEAGRRGQRGKDGLVKAAHSALFYSPELQALHIAQITRLLAHTNRYTGLTYAQDPAIAFIECINEQSILFSTSMGSLKAYPTIRRQTAARFSAWLKQKYGDQKALRAAWGDKAFDSFKYEGFEKVGEDLEKGNILPLGGPWYWEPVNLNGSQVFRKQRLLDTLEFLTMLQVECYANYVKALRSAGYDGEIIGSNWQAGSAYSHYANLYTDYTVGTIDRHNYFGGGGRSGKFGNGSMLARAGTGLLSSGMQQVIDRPFMLSEWIHCFPNERGVEVPAIIGAYGMGLQGWDVSYMFENSDAAGYSRALGGSTWDIMAPQVLGIFPAVARQVLRGDVLEASTNAVRNVFLPAAFAGKLGFDDTVKQGYDAKELDSSTVPARALAAIRSVVAFTTNDLATATLQMQPYLSNGCIVADGGQLRWKEGTNQQSGYITIDTPGTKAVVGFANGVRNTLGDVTITPACPYAAVYVSAQGKQESVENAQRLVIVAMSRARNTGMRFNKAEDTLLDVGTAPVMLEPVNATITLRREGVFKVIALNHDGMRTTTTIPVEAGTFMLDGARDKTPFYLIEFATPEPDAEVLDEAATADENR